MKVAIVSGKGGSGKSSVTAAFIDLSQKVIAVDCDVDASNLPLLFPHQVQKDEPFVSGVQLVVDEETCLGCGRCIARCRYGALQRNEQGKAVANDFLCEGCGLCLKVCPVKAISLKEEAESTIFTSTFAKGLMVHGNLCPGDDNSGKMIARIRHLADEAMNQEGVDLQILDGPPGIGCPVLSTVTGMDKIVIVSEPTLSGMADLERAHKVASSFCKDLSVLINKCDINEENREHILRFCEAHHIPVVGELPLDRRMVEAQLQCQSIVNYAPQSETAKILQTAYQQIFCE